MPENIRVPGRLVPDAPASTVLFCPTDVARGLSSPPPPRLTPQLTCMIWHGEMSFDLKSSIEVILAIREKKK